MKWEKYDLGREFSSEDIIETSNNESYKFQAEIIKKVHIFGEKLFGDFDVRCTVFDYDSNQVDVKEYEGMNGTFKGAKNLLEKCKSAMVAKYS